MLIGQSFDFARFEEMQQLLFNAVTRLYFTFPEFQYSPSPLEEQGFIPPVPFHVAIQLPFPKGPICLWPRRSWTPRMLMPEAAVYEYHRLPLGQDDVRFARKVGPMQSKPKSVTMQHSAHG